MSYNYSELNKIIELQYPRNNNNNYNNYNYNWLLEDTIKLGKGYIKPSNYINNIGNRIKSSYIKSDNLYDDPLYLHI